MDSNFRRVNFDWGQPALPTAVEWLLQQHRNGDLLDLSGWIVVTPSARSRRRLLQLLGRACVASGAVFRPGTFLTVGQLPEQLYTHEFPLAGEFESRLAWGAALADTPPRELEKLLPGFDPDDWAARLEMARTLQALHQRLAADAWSFASVHREVAGQVGFPETARWAVLEQIQQAYYRRLEKHGLWDRHAARNVAAKRPGPDGRPRCRCERGILLVGIVDLNRMLRLMLQQLEGPVVALSWSAAGDDAGFDPFGSLVPGFWCGRRMELAEEVLRIVDRPLDQADAVIEWYRSLPSGLSSDEVTVCAPDDDVAVHVQRLFAMQGLRTRRLDGGGLEESRVGQLVAAVCEWVRSGSFETLAALVRIPDLFARLSQELKTELWLDELDRFQNRCLPGWIDLSRFQRRRTGSNKAAPGVPEIGSELLAEIFSLLQEWLSPLAPEAAGRRGDAPGVEGSEGRESGNPAALEAARGAQFGSGGGKSRKAAGGKTAASAKQADRGLSLPGLWDESDSGILLAWGKLLEAVFGDRQWDPEKLEDQRVIEAIEVLAGTLQELAGLSRAWSAHLDAATIGELLLQSLAGHSLADHQDPEAVELAGWLDLPLDDAPAAILAGFNENHVPSSQTSHVLLPDSLCRRLGLQDNDRRYARDAWILMMLVRSRRHVCLVAGRRDAQNSPLLPSRLMFAEEDAVVLQRARAFFGHPGSTSQRRWMRADRPASIRQQLAVPQPIRLPAIQRLSVTRLRDYLKCPYRFYLSAVLGLESVRDDARELDGGAFGNLAHDVLEEFGDSRIADSANEDQIAEFLIRTLREFQKKALPLEALPAAGIQLANLEKRLERFAGIQAERRRQEWEIVRVEPKVEWQIDLDGQPFVIVGKIDRVDRHRDGRLAVWDYKTSDSGKTAEQAHRQQGEWVDFQLPLYRHLLTQVLPIPADGVDQIGLGYILLPRDLGEIRFDPVEWQPGELHAADEQVRAILRRIRDQVFWPMAATPPDFSGELSAICQDQVFERWQEETRPQLSSREIRQ